MSPEPGPPLPNPNPRNPSSGFIELNPSAKGTHILNDGAALNPSEYRHRETSTPAENRRELGIPEPSQGGGVGFDFYSPLDFKKEMARAEKKVAKEKGDFQYHKNTDLGHGIICNQKGRWILCKMESIQACNAKYNGMCRFAKEQEKSAIEEDIFF